MKKTIFTLNIDEYAPEITALTYPLLRYYANKIGANFHIIKERKFPDWPVTYEKLQIYELAREMGTDWNIFIDSDAVIHPDTPDWTNFLHKDTIAHNGRDFANLRWRYDNYFLRDGRNWGSCNWFTIASDWCVDIWKPLDIGFEEAVSNIFPVVDELNTVITRDHLIDDYALSRNIARYGIKAKTLIEIQKENSLENCNFHWHVYTVSIDKKLNGWEDIGPDGNKISVPGMIQLFENWKIPLFIRNYGN
jgi:hypothetical protein